jgi:hypothetical protein
MIGQQPLHVDEHGTVRFKKNAIVVHLLKTYTDLDELARLNFTDEDRRQFAQLIGYSLDGYGGLPYVGKDDYDRARALRESGNDEGKAAILRVIQLERQLADIKQRLAPLVSDLFDIHEDDLQ